MLWQCCKEYLDIYQQATNAARQAIRSARSTLETTEAGRRVTAFASNFRPTWGSEGGEEGGAPRGADPDGAPDDYVDNPLHADGGVKPPHVEISIGRTAGGIEMTPTPRAPPPQVVGPAEIDTHNPLHAGAAAEVEVVAATVVAAPVDDEAAALKIEAVARGGLVRRRSKAIKATAQANAAVRIEAVTRGGLARRRSKALRAGVAEAAVAEGGGGGEVEVVAQAVDGQVELAGPEVAVQAPSPPWNVYHGLGVGGQPPPSALHS